MKKAILSLILTLTIFFSFATEVNNETLFKNEKIISYNVLNIENTNNFSFIVESNHLINRGCFYKMLGI
jgi:hypothetical protein